MKFQTEICDSAPLITLIAGVAPLGAHTIIKLTDDKFCLIMSDDTIQYDIHSWAEIPVEDVFINYKIQSRAEENAIYLEVQIQDLLKALRATDHQSIIKLTKNDAGEGCLEFQYYGDERDIKMKQQVPVTLRHQDYKDFERPTCPTPSIKLDLPTGPGIKSMKGILDRLCKIDNDVTIEAHDQGSLRFKVSTEDTEAETRFQTEADLESSETTSKVQVKSRSLLRLFAGLIHLNVSRLLICFCGENLVVLGFSDDEPAIEYYISTQFEDGSDDDEIMGGY